jgi:hypothetical protein
MHKFFFPLIVAAVVACQSKTPEITAPVAISPTQSTPTTVSASTKQHMLVIDKVVVNETPQTGTWLMCFMAKSGKGENTFNVPDKTYSGDGITIDMGLAITPITSNDQINFNMFLDDDQADVCGNDAEDKSTDSFIATSQGSKVVERDNFNYIVYWHMQPL